MIGIIDYQRSNLYSIGRALDHIGAPYRFVSTKNELKNISRIILPGVGSFGDAMNNLIKSGLAEALHSASKENTPILGICLGMHLMAEMGEEAGSHPGLGLIPGSVQKLPQQPGLRIPNMGWRKIKFQQNSNSPYNSEMFYFLHSYTFIPKDKSHIEATLDWNGHPAPAIIRYKNIMGVQFHPEKSGQTGLNFIVNALSLA